MVLQQPPTVVGSDLDPSTADAWLGGGKGSAVVFDDNDRPIKATWDHTLADTQSVLYDRPSGDATDKAYKVMRMDVVGRLCKIYISQDGTHRLEMATCYGIGADGVPDPALEVSVSITTINELLQFEADNASIGCLTSDHRDDCVADQALLAESQQHRLDAPLLTSTLAAPSTGAAP